MNKHRRAISKQIKKIVRMDRSGQTTYKEARKLHRNGFRAITINDEWYLRKGLGEFYVRCAVGGMHG